MSSVGFVWDLGVNMEVSGIIVTDMRRRVQPMPETTKLEAEHPLKDIFMYILFILN
jgi:hypothetical protein